MRVEGCMCACTPACVQRNGLISSQISGILFPKLLTIFQGEKKKKMMDFSLISHRKSIISGCVVWLAKYLRHTKPPLVEISEMIYCSPSSEIRSRYARRQTQTFADLSLRVNGYMYIPPLIIPAQVTSTLRTGQ